MSATIEVPISDDLLALLDHKARIAGLKREEYVNSILVRELTAPQTLDEVLAEFRKDITASEFSNTQLEELFAEARDEAYARKVR